MKMLSVTITWLVEDMYEVTETAPSIAQQLQTVAVPPVGHTFVKSMANEVGSTATVRVELVPDEDVAMLNVHKSKRKELARH
jgi:hypothetical protein